jgi:diguanylate cyclase (GGDEF)-like protein
VLILVGENDSDAARQRAFSLGASDYINMPFSAGELQTRAGLQIRKFNQRIAEQEHEVVGVSAATDILNTLKQQETFSARLKQEMSFCVRHRAYVSAVLLSVADEDAITGQFDHSVLTALLRTLSHELESQIRHEDSFAYLGDATFALLFPVTNGLGAKVAIERIMQRISGLNLKHDGAEIPLSQNAALYSTIPEDSLSSDDVMNALEERLATARQKGAGQVISSRFEIENASLSVDQALNKIRYKQTDGLESHLPDLLPRLRPLLQFARQHDAPELQDVLDDISD